jgi:hypothetical protein
MENKYRKTGLFKKPNRFNFEIQQKNTNPLMNFVRVVKTEITEKK